MMIKIARACALLLTAGALAACAPEPPREVILVQPTLYNKDGTPIPGGECPDGYVRGSDVPGANPNECIPDDCPDGYIPGAAQDECLPPPDDCPPGQAYSSQTLECLPIGGRDPDPQRPEQDDVPGVSLG